MITTENIKALRDKTGVSIMQCKKALEEAQGDIEKALVILRKKSGELAAKKSDRTFGAGTIQAYIHANGAVGVLVELVCETDFVSGNNDFKLLARDIAMHVAAMRPEYIKEEEINEEAKKMMREVFEKEVENSDKPAEIKQKMLEGKIATYFKEKTLLDQAFIKDPNETISTLLAKNKATIKEVKRYSI
jgi:elongation factor Ts